MASESSVPQTAPSVCSRHGTAWMPVRTPQAAYSASCRARVLRDRSPALPAPSTPRAASYAVGFRVACLGAGRHTPAEGENTPADVAKMWLHGRPRGVFALPTLTAKTLCLQAIRTVR
jgi:hypothetical protein